MFLQETYELMDCILAYDGTSSQIPTIIQKSSSTYVSMIADNTGLSLSNSHSSSTYYVGLDKEGSSSSIGNWIDWKDVAFEFEYISHTGNCSVTIRPETSTHKTYSLSNCVTGDIIRLEASNDEITIYKNGESVANGTLASDELVSMRINLPPSSSTTIKNLKLYSI